MSLSEFTLVEVDNTLQVVNMAIRESIEDVVAVQSSLIRADGVSGDHCGVVLVTYMTKNKGGRLITATKEFTLQHSTVLSDVYVEEVCGELQRQWYFNAGEVCDYGDMTTLLHTYIQVQPADEAFLHCTNICDVLGDFMTHVGGPIVAGGEDSPIAREEDCFLFAGWLNKHAPSLYQTLTNPPSTYGELQVLLYGELTGVEL